MVKKISIVLLLLLNLGYSFANEKFLKVKGNLIDGTTHEEISNFRVKIVLDGIDSSETIFENAKYDIWLPANRKAKIFFLKTGYQSKFLLVDASFIPSFAHKKKQLIDIKVKLIKSKSQPSNKPFCTANFKASEAKFILVYENIGKPKVNKNFKSPFPLPSVTFKGARPTDNNLKTVELINSQHLKTTSPYFLLSQGVIFANINYCVFNERIQKSNTYLSQLADIDKDNWANVKPFDSPEYANIVLKTLNLEKSRDSLFAFGCWIGTSQLLMQNFTTNSKIIMHGKKLILALDNYKGIGLNQTQKEKIILLKEIADLYKKLVENYMKSMKNRTPIDLKNNVLFIEIKAKNDALFNTIIS